jgi:hypothetical protein
MKRSKLLILLIIFPVSPGLIIATAYFNSANNSHNEALPSDSLQSTVPPSPIYELQILSPENITYQTSHIPLNVSSNWASKVTYILDGGENRTLRENGETRGLPDGVHRITFYAFDNESKLRTFRTVIFTVKNQPPPPPTEAEAINYFTSQGFTIQKVSNITIEVYMFKDVPLIRNNSLALGLTEVAVYAQTLNTTVIKEFEYDLHWKFFFVEHEITHCKFYVHVYD